MGRLAPQQGTRVQRFRQQLGTLTYASAGVASVDLKRSDYTLSLDLVSHQTVTSGGTIPVVAGYGAFGPEQLVQVIVGGQSPISLSGYALDAIGRYKLRPYESQQTASTLTASTTTNWTNDLRIPFTITPDTERGCFYTGDPSLQMTLSLTCGTAAQTFSTVNGATIQGSWNVWREVISAPAPTASPAFLDAISWLHQLQRVYSSTAALGAGVTDISIGRNRDYENIYVVAYTGNNNDGTFAPATGLISHLSLIINDTIRIYDTVEEGEMIFEANTLLPAALPGGVYVIPFERIRNSIRDILPTDGPAVTSVTVEVDTGSSNTTHVDIITESVVDSPFAAEWVAAAAQVANGAKAA